MKMHFSDISYDEFHAVPRGEFLRMRWIDDTLDVYGYFNRAHVTRAFGVTPQTASNTIREYQRITAGALEIVRGTRIYVRKGAKLEDHVFAPVLKRDPANGDTDSRVIGGQAENIEAEMHDYVQSEAILSEGDEQ